jgi:hypothetical protein
MSQAFVSSVKGGWVQYAISHTEEESRGTNGDQLLDRFRALTDAEEGRRYVITETGGPTVCIQ